MLIDSISGKVLYQKRCHVRRPPASTTKVMTAILALENGNLQASVTASPKAVQTEFGSLNLRPGEKMTLDDCLHGMLLRSANDAAVCVAENIAGSESKFVEMMNAKAKEIGAKDTHFVHPHGLYDPKHYSTAYDLALIARYAIQYPAFNEIVKTKVCRISRSINKQDVAIKNTANFLWKYDGADGIKTGYTKEAGHCFVGSATRDGWRLIAVVLKSRSCGHDTASLIDYGFNTFKPVVFARTGKVLTTTDVPGGVIAKVGVVPAKNLATVIQKNQPAVTKSEVKFDRITAPFKKGEKIGVLTGYVNGKPIGSVNLLSARSVGRNSAATAWLVFKWLITIVVLGLLGIIGYGRTVTKAARRRRRSITTRSGAVDLVRASGSRRQSRYPARTKSTLITPPLRSMASVWNRTQDMYTFYCISRGGTPAPDETPYASKVVTELVKDVKVPLYPVGRLDVDTEGLLILTNDGDFAFKITHPKHHVPKTYRAEVRGLVKREALNQLAAGVVLEDGVASPAKVQIGS